MICEKMNMTWLELEAIRHGLDRKDRWGQAKLAFLMGYTIDGYKQLGMKSREFIPEQTASTAMMIKYLVENGMAYADIAELKLRK